jgi:hypothetical protein
MGRGFDMRNIHGDEEPKLEPIPRPGEPTDYQVFRLLEDQWRDGDGAYSWLIKEGLARGIIKKVDHPDYPVIKEPWYEFIRIPKDEKTPDSGHDNS